jgi:DNA repair exonuclease SbcCD ATPase subunit
MKNYKLMLFVAVPMILAGCNKEKVENLTTENVTLKGENDKLAETLNSYLETFNEIESNLAEIKEREEKIGLATSDEVENSPSAEKAILADIKAINALLADNKARIAELQQNLQGSSVKVKEFNKLVNNLQARVEEKNVEVNELKVTLAALNTSNKELLDNVAELSMKVDTLNGVKLENETTINEQSDLLATQQAQLNTGYVATGTYKKLKEEQVVTKEGGVLGLGKVEKLNADFNNASFERIDITATSEILLAGKKVDIVTNHPGDSYKVREDETGDFSTLVITNPEEFWKSSKYLVAVVN